MKSSNKQTPHKLHLISRGCSTTLLSTVLHRCSCCRCELRTMLWGHPAGHCCFSHCSAQLDPTGSGLSSPLSAASLLALLFQHYIWSCFGLCLFLNPLEVHSCTPDRTGGKTSRTAEGSDLQGLMLTPSQSEEKWSTSSKRHQAFPGKNLTSRDNVGGITTWSQPHGIKLCPSLWPGQYLTCMIIKKKGIIKATWFYRTIFVSK